MHEIVGFHISKTVNLRVIFHREIFSRLKRMGSGKRQSSLSEIVSYNPCQSRMRNLNVQICSFSDNKTLSVDELLHICQPNEMGMQ